jgi:hypothetical protein
MTGWVGDIGRKTLSLKAMMEKELIIMHPI